MIGLTVTRRTLSGLHVVQNVSTVLSWVDLSAGAILDRNPDRAHLVNFAARPINAADYVSSFGFALGRAEHDALAGGTATVRLGRLDPPAQPYDSPGQQERHRMLYGKRIYIDTDDLLDRAEMIDEVLGELDLLPETR